MPNNKRISTDELLTQLFKEQNLEHFLQRNESVYLTISFADYLNAWCKKHLEVPEQVIRRANLEKSYGHQLFSGVRRPSRDKVIQLALGMELGVEETQKLLRAAGKSELYPRLKREAVILYCLRKGASVLDTQELLSKYGFSLLGSLRN